MNLIRRAMLYSVRRKGKTLGLFLLSAVISTFLLSCFSILHTAEALEAEIRQSIGAAFYIRANSKVVANERGERYVEENNFRMTEDNIAEIEKCGHTAYCNPVNYGYAKSDEIAFVPGERDDPDSRMGQITALRYSALYSDFADKIVALSEGRHITESDQGVVVISAEIARRSGLSAGDTVTLTSAAFGVEDEKGTDAWQGDRKAVKAHILGIYDILEEKPPAAATAAKQENRIYASLDVLLELGESEPAVYTGEVDFYVIDPAGLAEMIPKVRRIQGIDWETHFVRTNDFRYSELSDSLKSLSRLAEILLVCISVVSTAVVILILTLGIRNRIREAGIFLAAGISKGEILMQFLFEVLAVVIPAFIVSYAACGILKGSLAGSLFADFRVELMGAEVLDSGTGVGRGNEISYHLGIGKTLAIDFCQLTAMAAAVVISSLSILRLKPREILRHG